MARQPIQAHIFLFREGKKGYEYGIFQRSDEPVYWQGICGGLEGSVVVIPMYFFAMKWDRQVRLSNEHLAMRWLGYEEAYDLIYYMDQKIALYELHEKLRRGML